MFLSTSHNKIDLKCRVSIPASFRVNLEKSNETLILFKSLQFNCIEGTTSSLDFSVEIKIMVAMLILVFILKK